MRPLGAIDYLKTLKTRVKEARITKPFQLTGLEIAMILKDLPHKSLYMKYAKEYPGEKLLALAKDIMERRGIANPAAYFMTVVSALKKERK